MQTTSDKEWFVVLRNRCNVMGIGRREFVRLMTIALAGAAVAPNAAVAINEDYYINRRLGILFSKPRGWNYIAVADFGELREKQIPSNIQDEDQDEFWETIGYPTCMITKYAQDLPKYKGVFSPTIQFYVNHKSEFAEIEYDTFEEFIQCTRESTSEILKDFEVTSEKDCYEVEGCKFYEYYASYTFEHIDLKEPIKVRLNVVIAGHNNFYYFMNLHDCPEQNQVAVKEFEEFKRSLRMI